MRDEPTEDLLRRYVNSYFMGTYKGKNEIVYIVDFAESDKRQNPTVYFNLSSGDSGKAAIVDLNPREEYPEKGIYNVPKDTWGAHRSGHSWPVLFYNRKPVRQWHHGVNGQTGTLSCVLTAFTGGYISYPKSITQFAFNMVKELFYPTYPVWETVFDLLKTQPMFALSRELGICAAFDDKDYWLFRHGTIIGRATPTHISLGEPLFYQEVQDYINRNRLKVTLDVLK